MAGESIDAFLWFGEGRVGQDGLGFKITGETTDAEHRSDSAMQIKNYTFDFTMDTTSSEQKQGAKGEKELPDPTFTPAKITKLVDTASPLLFKALCMGAKFDKVDISQRKAGHAATSSGGEFWHIEMGGVTIENVNWAADESTGIITENLSLRFESIEVTYRKQAHHGRMDTAPVKKKHELQGPEGLKDKNKNQGNGGLGSDASQVAGLVDKVISELGRRRLIGQGANAGGTPRHGR